MSGEYEELVDWVKMRPWQRRMVIELTCQPHMCDAPDCHSWAYWFKVTVYDEPPKGSGYSSSSFHGEGSNMDMACFGLVRTTLAAQIADERQDLTDGQSLE